MRCTMLLLSCLALPVAAQTAAPRVQVVTSAGEFTLELNAERAPKSVANFLKYVESGHYAGTIFHRVIKDFMIQGGGFSADMSQKSVQAPIQNEAANGLKNVRGSIAMARTGDPHSATAQFFINTVDNNFLDYPGQDGWGYAVFGKVVTGMDVIDRIRSVPTTNAGMHQNVPVKPVTIQSMKLLPAPAAK
ncbi:MULTISPECIES: peptidylprolyl isomerase [unclassified Uliginosibacterium]|nr:MULTISPECIES: peptidylprolyl isomerase [unclassified Uliginosibacterium]MDO6385149.1 peptidylprolyl isomerase [Uliginosibacterium sp. 31-12]PLK48913.1 peptidyl-prolyl cis-trans isomerase A [Uliginosibacterium sp. TH139]